MSFLINALQFGALSAGFGSIVIVPRVIVAVFF